MQPYCIYVFDSSTANEAALAVKDGQYESIIQYHSNKHQHMANKPHPHQPPPPPLSMQGPQSHLHPQHVSPHMMNGPPPYPPPHHVSPPNHMQPQSQHPIGVPPPQMPPQQQQQQQPPPPPIQQQQPYDPNLSPQKMKERESKLNRLSQLAHLTTAPPTMHQMTNSNPSQRSQQPPQHQLPPQPQAQQHQPIPHPQQQQQQPPPPQQQQQPQHVKQEQLLDPLSSMAAMSECPTMDNYGHTIHHHPPS